MADAALTTEQLVKFTIKAEDGRGRPVELDGDPTAVSSDETVASVSMSGLEGTITAVVEGTARVVVSADAAPGEAVNMIQGTIDVTVTRDPRTDARTVNVTVGAPEDKPV